MLQQTQVTTVVPYYTRFLARFPDVPTLAAAPLDAVLTLWAGLGYYARARNLHQAARQMVAQHQGQLPTDSAVLQTLPGIGRSTAGAILALSQGQRQAILDGNVKRVLARYAAIPGWPSTTAVSARLWQLAEYYTPNTDVAAYTQAMMDLGATLCTRTQPRCTVCPLQLGCLGATHWQDYPAPKPRQALPQRRRYGLLLTNPDGALLLLQRPPSGIWGGLWSLPEAADLEAAQQWCVQHAVRLQTPLTPLPPIQHVFTHFRLELIPLHATAEPDATSVCETSERWVAPTDLTHFGLPAPIQRLLRDWV